MFELVIKAKTNSGLDGVLLREALAKSIGGIKSGLRKVLLLPSDFTRKHSGSGEIAAVYYEMLSDSCEVDVMPALGTHDPMSRQECRKFFGDCIPSDRIIKHDWRRDVVKLGEVPGAYLSKVSEDLLQEPIDVEVNRRLLDKSYDLIISVGQVVPHEVVGMANYSKNIFVGCGGNSMINKTHMLGACYGMERIMGRDHSPVRKVFDYAEEKFLKDLPLLYVLTVTSQTEGTTAIHGLFIGRRRKIFEEAVKLSQEKNITIVDRPLQKVVVYLDPAEFKSTWLGNKAIYRTRMAIADGGELLILAPGVRKFGEDAENDRLIRKYGYIGRKKILELCKQKQDLLNSLAVAAHLIHGSSDGRFSITYAVEKLTSQEIEGVNYNYLPWKEAFKRYNPVKLKEGINVLADGEEIFYINNPALGLWTSKSIL